jgi:hypothetical protein
MTVNLENHRRGCMAIFIFFYLSFENFLLGLDRFVSSLANENYKLILNGCQQIIFEHQINI